MPFWSMLSMSPAGLSFPAGFDGGYPHSVEVREDLLSTEQQTSCVLVLGNGLASHWAVVMIFENGEVFSVELLARDMVTGERWGTSNFQMCQLRLEDRWERLDWENLSEASSQQDVQDEGNEENEMLIPRFGCIPLENVSRNLSQACMYQDSHQDYNDVENRLHDHPRQSTYADNSEQNDIYSEINNLEANTAAGHAGQRLKSAAVDDEITAMCNDLCRTFRRQQFLHGRQNSRIALIEDYIRHFGYRMLCEILWVQQTSPARLYRRAKAVPLNGSQYDLLFHNCQLWVVMLLHDYYGIQFWKLPWTIGCLVAGPLLLIVELSFLGVYLGLLHLLPAVAIVFGLLWFGVLVWFSILYHGRSREGTFPFEMALGGVILLGAPILDRSASLETSLPFITLVWDVVVVFQSMRHTMVFRSPFLIVWNVGTTLIAVGLATAAQTHYGVHAAPAVASNVEAAIGSSFPTMMLWAWLLLVSAFLNIIRGVGDLCAELCEGCRRRR